MPDSPPSWPLPVCMSYCMYMLRDDGGVVVHAAAWHGAEESASCVFTPFRLFSALLTSWVGCYRRVAIVIRHDCLAMSMNFHTCVVVPLWCGAPLSRDAQTQSSPSEIAEWIETAGGFCQSGSERRRRLSEASSAAAQAAERDIAAEFHLSVSAGKKPLHRSVSAASFAHVDVSRTSGVMSSPVVSPEPILRFTPAQATVRKEGKLVLAMVCACCPGLLLA